MDKVINLGIPHIREQIFENIDTDKLLQYLKVSHICHQDLPHPYRIHPPLVRGKNFYVFLTRG